MTTFEKTELESDPVFSGLASSGLSQKTKSEKSERPHKSEKSEKSEKQEKSGKLNRNDEILGVATKVFAQRGFRNTDVQEIADLVGIGKATIYRAFGTKEELFFAAVDYGMQLLNEQMINHEHSLDENIAPQVKMESCFLNFFRFFNNHEELVELLIQERSEFRDRPSNSYTRNWLNNSPRWQKRVTDNIENGRFRDIEPKGVIQIFNSLCYGVLFTHYFSKQKVDLEYTASLMTDIVLKGLLSESERLNTASGKSTNTASQPNKSV